MDFFNNYHLGDCIYALHYFNKLCSVKDGFSINFYVNPVYFSELREWNKHTGRINLLNINYKIPNSIDTWIGKDNFYYEHMYKVTDFDEFYRMFFEKFSKENSFPVVIKDKIDTFLDNDKIVENKIYMGDIEYLVVNSDPMSGQVDKEDLNKFNKLIRFLRNRGTVITTKKTDIEGVLCTQDYSMSLMDIAKLSLRCKNIIGVHTSPMIVALNRYRINKGGNIILLQKHGLKYNTGNTINIKKIDDIYGLL